MSQLCATPRDAEAPTILCRDWIEERIIRAYVRLVFAPDQDSGSRTIPIMSIGSLDVRLTEVCHDDELPTFQPLWVEVYSHASNSVIAFCGSYEFDEEEIDAAVDLVVSAYTDLSNLH